MFEKYLVKSGDSLEYIASKFNTSIDTLINMNNLNNGKMLRVDQELIVPKGNENYFDYYKIEKGDNLYQIALKYNVNPELLANLNGLKMNDYIYPNQELLIPKNGYSYYITAQGDTLDLVASRFNISKENLINNNDTIYLMEGQLLVNRTR